MAALPGMVATAALAGQEIRVEVGSPRHFVNTLAEAVPLEAQGAPAMALPQRRPSWKPALR